MAFNPLGIANALEEIFFQIRQRATPSRYDGVRVRDLIVFLDGTMHGDPRPGEILHPFPELRSIVDEYIKRALLMYDGGMDALVLLYPFVNALSTGRSDCPVIRIEEVSATLHSPKLQFIDRTRPETECYFERPHYFYKITWFNGDVYAVDVTYMQFGHVDPICAWHRVQLEWGLTVNNVFPLGHVHRVIYPNFGHGPDWLLVSRCLETMELANCITANIILNAWRLSRKGPLEKLLEELVTCVDTAMEDLYSLEKVSERLKEIEYKLQAVDVDRTESTQGFMSFLTKGSFGKGG